MLRARSGTLSAHHYDYMHRCHEPSPTMPISSYRQSDQNTSSISESSTGETLERQGWGGSKPSCLVQIPPSTEPSWAALGLSPFLIGQTFVREHSWEYSGNIVGSWANFCFANIAGGIRRTVTKIYSGSKKIRSTCSGHICPIQ